MNETAAPYRENRKHPRAMISLPVYLQINEGGWGYPGVTQSPVLFVNRDLGRKKILREPFSKLLTLPTSIPVSSSNAIHILFSAS
jgi:hypothetical protein